MSLLNASDGIPTHKGIITGNPVTRSKEELAKTQRNLRIKSIAFIAFGLLILAAAATLVAFLSFGAFFPVLMLTMCAIGSFDRARICENERQKLARRINELAMHEIELGPVKVNRDNY